MSEFTDSIRDHKLYKRLKDVSTMLPPPGVFKNRLDHTEDVVKVAKKIKESFDKNGILIEFPDYLEESCLIHDIGHCSFSHECEVAFNEFACKKLGITKKEFSFKHSVNGALVLASAAYPSKKKKDPKNEPLQRLNVFKNYDKINIDRVVEGMIKHSINDDVINGLYYDFVKRLYKEKTNGHNLPVSNEEKDNNAIVYYVRVADDIATKNSDLIDLFHLYHNDEYMLLFGTEHTCKNDSIQDFYIKKITHLISSPNHGNIEQTMKSISEYRLEKEFLELTYCYEPKHSITSNLNTLIIELLELVCKKPVLFRTKKSSASIIYSFKDKGNIPINYSRSIKFIRNVCKRNGISLNEEGMGELEEKYRKRPSKDNPYFKVFSDYICSLVYEMSSFTDIGLLDFARRVGDKLSEKGLSSLDYLEQVFTKTVRKV